MLCIRIPWSWQIEIRLWFWHAFSFQVISCVEQAWSSNFRSNVNTLKFISINFQAKMVIYFCEWSHTELSYDGIGFSLHVECFWVCLKLNFFEIDSIYQRNHDLLKSILITSYTIILTHYFAKWFDITIHQYRNRGQTKKWPIYTSRTQLNAHGEAWIDTYLILLRGSI